jgi:hypothetical protein
MTTSSTANEEQCSADHQSSSSSSSSSLSVSNGNSDSITVRQTLSFAAAIQPSAQPTIDTASRHSDSNRIISTSTAATPLPPPPPPPSLSSAPTSTTSDPNSAHDSDLTLFTPGADSSVSADSRLRTRTRTTTSSLMHAHVLHAHLPSSPPNTPSASALASAAFTRSHPQNTDITTPTSTSSLPTQPHPPSIGLSALWRWFGWLAPSTSTQP